MSSSITKTTKIILSIKSNTFARFTFWQRMTVKSQFVQFRNFARVVVIDC